MTELAFTQQIKLAEISAFNWGSFDGLHTARVDPDGTLITGDNGSGKTTLVDGLWHCCYPRVKTPLILPLLKVIVLIDRYCLIFEAAMVKIMMGPARG